MILFLERVTSKGNCYLYLRQYSVREHYHNNKITVFSFGRIERALKTMYSWNKDFQTFPQELIEIGCSKEDLQRWIETLETGVHQKTGRKFNCKFVSKVVSLLFLFPVF